MSQARGKHGFTADGKAAASLPQGESRHFAIWQRPMEICPGWTRAVRIIIPDAALQARPASATPKKPVTEFPATQDGDATIAEIWLESAVNPTHLPLNGSLLAGRLSQPSGGIAWIVGRRTTLPWDPYLRFSPMIDAALSDAVELVPDWTGDPPMSICLYDPAGPRDDLMLCELAVHRGSE